MTSNMTDNLEAMLARGKDSPTLRLALAGRYFEQGDFEKAIEHAEVAVQLDADYSAAWKLLGKVLAASGLKERAADTFREGMAVARRRGDQQAAKEMQVFLRRLETGGK